MPRASHPEAAGSGLAFSPVRSRSIWHIHRDWAPEHLVRSCARSGSADRAPWNSSRVSARAPGGLPDGPAGGDGRFEGLSRGAGRQAPAPRPPRQARRLSGRMSATHHSSRPWRFARSSLLRSRFCSLWTGVDSVPGPGSAQVGSLGSAGVEGSTPGGCRAATGRTRRAWFRCAQAAREQEIEEFCHEY